MEPSWQVNENQSAMWLERLIVVLFAFVFLILSLANFNCLVGCVLQSSDTVWLIKTGQYTLAHGLPVTDPFSWTCAGKPIVIYQWLFAVAIALVFQSGGLWLVGLASAVIAAITSIGFLSNSMLRQGIKPVYVFGLLSLISTPAWFWARPQLISFLLIYIFIYLLENFRKYGFGKTPWLLPPLMVLWVNTHSFWFIGLLMVFCYFFNLLSKSKHLCLFLLCCFAVLANPYGTGIFSYNLTFLSEPDFGKIFELQSNLLTSPQSNFGLLIYLTLVWIAIIVGRAAVPSSGLMLAALSTCAALMFYRFAPVAVLLTWPYLGLALSQFSIFKNETSETKENKETSETKESEKESLSQKYSLKSFAQINPLIMPVFAAVCACVFYSIKFPPGKPIWFSHSNSNLGAINILRQHPELRDRMFCSAAFGCSQILEDLGPVFIDTRFDFYGKKFCAEYDDCIHARGDWQAYLNKWQIKSLCIENTFPLYRELQFSKCWQSVFDDGKCSIWKR